ncbi:hypothetical protein WJX77_003170 [Trebouxia sp. C0004]
MPDETTAAAADGQVGLLAQRGRHSELLSTCVLVISCAAAASQAIAEKLKRHVFGKILCSGHCRKPQQTGDTGLRLRQQQSP